MLSYNKFLEAKADASGYTSMRDSLNGHTQKLSELNLGFHGGSMENFAEKPGSAVVGTSLPFTGHYMFGQLNNAVNRGNRATGKDEFKIIDLSQYNLFNPYDSSSYFRIMNAMRLLPYDTNKGVTADEEKLNSALDEVIEYLSQFKNLTRFRSEIEQNRDSIIKNILSNKDLKPATSLMLALGYDGIEARELDVLSGDADPDSPSWGTIIFTEKPNTIVSFERGIRIDEDMWRKGRFTLKVVPDEFLGSKEEKIRLNSKSPILQKLKEHM